MTAALPLAALIVAAGSGLRAARDGDAVPKQYRRLGSRTVLGHSMARFLAHEDIAALAVVIREEDRDHYQAVAAEFTTAIATGRLLAPIRGGENRRESVLCGLECFAATIPPQRILIHDAARPFVDAATISAVAAAVTRHDGATAAVPLADTLRHGVASSVAMAACGNVIAREGLWRAQTPQGFVFAALLQAHRRLAADATAYSDDIEIARRDGLDCVHVADSPWNMKLTHADDFDRFNRFAESLAVMIDTPAPLLLTDMRIGHGFDAHCFGPGDHIRLGGVTIPHDHGLVGHSDADVVLHALTDAILGTFGGGDIGMHFPADEPQWRGADSRHFVALALDLLADRDGRLHHVDIVVICQAPRLSPFRDVLVENLSRLLGLPPDRIGFKATTTDGMGFTGRGEGLAAHAHATVLMAAAPNPEPV